MLGIINNSCVSELTFFLHLLLYTLQPVCRNVNARLDLFLKGKSWAKSKNSSMG